ncbi:MAG TPA: acyl-CoA thioesterase domain-containing protein [Polyangiaceae bacterium]|nr:acyl-CoA thioesterase domain-containing protein [Polyangiaceae bacterium]
MPEGWQQGRGAFGGLVPGALTRAMAASEPEPARALRSLSAELLGPVPPGPADVGVEVLRRGSVAVADGFVTEMRELWTAEGRALAFNQQTFVMIERAR